MSSFKNRTTPGVYITELNAFPNSIPGVQTAVPAFIGYTQHAVIGGMPSYFKPVRINSLADYESIFGKGFDPIYKIATVTPDLKFSNYDFMTQGWDQDKKAFVPKYFTLTRSSTLPDHRQNELEPEGDAAAPEPEGEVENDIGPEAAPDIVRATLGIFALYNSVRLFYANGGGTCYIVSVGPYINAGALTPITVDALKKGLDAIREQSGPTMLVVPDAVLLAKTSDSNGFPISAQFQDLCRYMLTQCADLQDRVAILDVYGTDTFDPAGLKNGTLANDVTALIENFQQDVGEFYLNYGMAYFPFLSTSIIPTGEISYYNLEITDTTQWTCCLKTTLTDQAAYLYSDPTNPSPTDDKNPAYLKIKAMIETISTVKDTPEDPNARARPQPEAMVNAIPLLGEVENIIATKMSLLPPSGAMAGVCTLIDANRGVWNAPANMVLNAVLAPNIQINADLQGPINVPINGKAVNVIRDFVNRGPVVWGARTLDGNSNDWKYIQVRRTIVYIEQSLKASLNMFVFAANTGTTWVGVTAMVSGFLNGLWTQGGLMGGKPDEAFTVQCGLGSTMTGMDILQGYMVVQVTLQMIRPAEFIELTFKQRMEGVA